MLGPVPVLFALIVLFVGVAVLLAVTVSAHRSGDFVLSPRGERRWAAAERRLEPVERRVVGYGDRALEATVSGGERVYHAVAGRLPQAR